MTGPEFEKWLSAMNISGAEAGRLLGVTPNTITRYRQSGAPLVVGLACTALFDHRPRKAEVKKPPRTPPFAERVAAAELLLTQIREAGGQAELARKLGVMPQVINARVKSARLVLEQRDSGDPIHTLSARCQNYLTGYHIKSFADLAGKTFRVSELKRLPNMGKTSIQEFTEWCARHGVPIE